MAEFRGTRFVSAPKKPVVETKETSKPHYKQKPDYLGVARAVEGMKNYIVNKTRDLYQKTTSSIRTAYSTVKSVPQKSPSYQRKSY